VQGPVAGDRDELDIAHLADADELAAHEELLAALDKASGGKTVWRRDMA